MCLTEQWIGDQIEADSVQVVQANSGRIWDIGDLEYSLVKPFIDEVPMEQLAEIEANSPVRPQSFLPLTSETDLIH